MRAIEWVLAASVVRSTLSVKSIRRNIASACDIGQVHRRKIGRAMECKRPYGEDTMATSDAVQVVALLECPCADRSHTRGPSD